MSIVASITVAWQNVTADNGSNLKTIETDIASDDQGSPPNFTDLDGAIDRAREVLDFARNNSNGFGIEDPSKLARAHITLHPGDFILTDDTETSDFQNPSSGNDDVFLTALPGARIDDQSSNFDVGDPESVISILDALTRVSFDRSAPDFTIFEDFIADDQSTFKGAATFEDSLTAQSQADFQSTVSFSDTITIQGSDVDEVSDNSSNTSSTALLTASAVDSKVPSDTDAVSEGSNNLYFTQSRVFQTLRDGDFGTDSDPETNGKLQAGNDITFNVDDNAETITIALDGSLGAVAPETQDDGGTIVSNTDVFNFTNLLNVQSPVSGQADVSVESTVFDTATDTTDDITEGSNNLFFTESRVFSANQLQLVGGSDIDINVDTTNEQFTFDFVGTAGASVSDGGTQILPEPSDLNFGTDLGVTDDGDGSVTIDFVGNVSAASPDVEDSGTTVVTDVSILNFTNLLDVTNPNSGEAAIAVNDDLSQYDNSTSGFISGLDIDDSGADVNTGVNNLNFGANLSVTDDGGGAVTIDGAGASDTRTNVSDDGSQIVTDTDDINFGTDLAVTDDGDNSVTVDSTYSVEAQDDGNTLSSKAILINFNNLLEASSPSPDEIEVNGVDTVQQARGTATFSGDGSTTQFVITHGLGYVPRQWFIEEVTDDASNVSHATADADTITVFYDTAPPSGTDNVVLKFATDLKSPDSGGEATFSGDGNQIQFLIPHGLGETPSEWFVEEASEDARGIAFTDADSTNIIVNYDTPPPSGTDNVVLNYAALVQSPTTFSGDGTKTQFQIPHGLSQTPNDWHVEAISDDASGFFHTTANDTFVTVNYGTAPPSGTDNIEYNLDARL